jgi:cytochrome c-type biogenesis protein CcmH/NrfF
LAIYGELVVLKPPGSPNAFLFVAVPPASWVFMTIVVLMAAFISGRLSRRGAGA